MGRRLAVCAFVMCLHAMLVACGSRTGGARVPDAPAIGPMAASPIPPTVAAALPASPPPPIGSVVDECAVIPGVALAQTETTSNPIAIVGLTDRIDPVHAPRPANESERLLFRQLYETLVRADCLGRAVPGLAVSWRRDADGRTWLVTLREDARFSDGTPVAPRDVRASWTGDGVEGSLRPEVARLVESVTETGDRTLAIRLRSRRIDIPLSLAHPDLAIAKSVAGAAWPLGTRSGLGADGRTSPITITRDHVEVMRFLIAPGDPRDLLDRGVDLLLTENPATLDYANSLPSFQSSPLSWQRTRVLMTPGRPRDVPLLSSDQREALAADAVRGEARGARGPFWWQRLSDCEVPAASPAANATPSVPGQRTPSPITPRIVYDGRDDVARDLAERFVGLNRAAGPAVTAFLDVLLPDRPRRTYQRATGLTGDALAAARRSGRDAGYVVLLDSHPIDPCRDRQILVDEARWLDPETIVPLVETRVHAIIRRGRAGVTAEWDGGLRIAPAEAAPDSASRPR
jgi:hypothetical protein